MGRGVVGRGHQQNPTGQRTAPHPTTPQRQHVIPFKSPKQEQVSHYLFQIMGHVMQTVQDLIWAKGLSARFSPWNVLDNGVGYAAVCFK